MPASLIWFEALYRISIPVIQRVAPHTDNKPPSPGGIVAPSFVLRASIGKVECNDCADRYGYSIPPWAALSLWATLSLWAALSLWTVQGVTPLLLLEILFSQSSQDSN